MKSNTLPVDAPAGGEASATFGTVTSKGGAGVVDKNEKADVAGAAAAVAAGAWAGAGAAPMEFRKENPENADPPPGALLVPPSFSFSSGELPFSSRPPNMTDNDESKQAAPTAMQEVTSQSPASADPNR